jgi:hypothetical protein
MFSFSHLCEPIRFAIWLPCKIWDIISILKTETTKALRRMRKSMDVEKEKYPNVELG